MGLLSRLKALLGLETERTEPTRRDNVDVTIERTPEGADEPDAETEAAVKGVEETPPAESEPETEPEAEAEPESEAVIEEAETEADAEAEAESAPEPEAEAEEPEPEVDEAEPEAEPADEAEPEGQVALEEIKGIGPSYADRLSDAGVDTVAELAGADADDLAEQTDLSAKRISRWIERAKDY